MFLNKFISKYKLVIILIFVAIFGIFIFASSMQAVFKNNLETLQNTATKNLNTDVENKLLQFTSQGHILGFNNDGMYVASATHMLKTSFVNANIVSPRADGNMETDASGKAPELTKVTYENIWNGITAVYEKEQDAIVKSTYYIDITKQGVTPDTIRLKYNRPISIDKNGNLQITYDDGIITEKSPIAWQETEEGRMPVTVAFAIKAEQEVGFIISNYLPNIPIVIDPSITWSTFLGGSGGDAGNSIAVDSSGNVYVGGQSDATWGTPIRVFAGVYDAYVAKLNSSGVLQWNTFLGGASAPDVGGLIDIDSSGNIYVGGYSYGTWGTPVRAYGGGMDDAFAAKLNNNGVLQWNTFLGGTGTDEGYSIATDSSGNVYVGGFSSATWGGSPVRPYGGGAVDAFAVKLNTSGVLQWNTFLGGTSADEGHAIAVDSSGNVYVGGYSTANWGSPVRAFSPGFDAFAVKLNGSGVLQWNTFLGSNSSDDAYAIAVDSSGNVYVSGYSVATWGVSPVRAKSLSDDAFAVKLNSSGVLQWNTFLGGG